MTTTKQKWGFGLLFILLYFPVLVLAKWGLNANILELVGIVSVWSALVFGAALLVGKNK